MVSPAAAVGVSLFLVIVLFGDFILSDGMLFGSDTIPSGIFFRRLYRDHVRTFLSMPLWDRYILGGLPFVDAMHGDTFYPTSILQFLLPLHRALGYKLILHVFLAGVGMYLFLRALGLRQPAVLLGSLTYMFAPTFVTFVFAGQDAKMYVIALLPFQFYFLERGFQERSLKPFLLLGGVTGLTILSSHNQMAYFALWGVGLYFLYKLYGLREETETPNPLSRRVIGRHLLFFGAALVTAIGIGAVQLLPTYSYLKGFSVRGTAEKTSYEHATSFSLHPEEIASLVVPEFSGYQSKGGDTYWGRNPLKLNSEYAGIIPLVFGVLALVGGSDRRSRFFMAGGLLALVYALTYHLPLFRICYEVVPGVKNFRSQGMIAFLYAFCACTLGAMGIHRVLDSPQRGSKERMLTTLRTLGAISLAGGIVGIFLTRPFIDLWVGLFYSDITEDKRQVLARVLPDIQMGIAICSCISLVGVILAWGRVKEKLSTAAFVLGLGGLVLLDTWRIDRQFVQVVDPGSLPGFRSDRVIADLQRRQGQEGPFRVLALGGVYARNELGAHGIETVAGQNGFHDNEIRWFRRLRGESDEHLAQGLSLGSDGQLVANALLNLLNVRYVLYGEGGRIQVLRNPTCLDRAFVASSCEVLNSEDRILERLLVAKPGFEDVVLLEEDPHWGVFDPGKGKAGAIQHLSYAGDDVQVSVRMDRKGILVLSDNYLPYWTATDNGKKVPILRAFGALRAIGLDVGDHHVRFAYRSGPYNWGKGLSLLAIVGLSIALLGKTVFLASKKVVQRPLEGA